MESSRWRYLYTIFALSAIFTLFLFGTSFLIVDHIYVSPDETANAFFAEQFAQTSQFRFFEPLNLVLSDVLHPRSVVSLNGELVPGSFLGLPAFYGSLMTFFGSGILSWLTPLFAAIGVIAWFGITRTFLDRTTAILSAFLWLFHPALWYYSARSLMPNVLFLSLVLCAFFFLIRRPFRLRFFSFVGLSHLAYLDLFFSGWLIALALFVRTSEAPWVMAIAMVCFIALRKTFSWKDILIAIAGFCLGLSPLFFLQWLTFGDPFVNGYTIGRSMENVIISPSLSSIQTSDVFFPFGLLPRIAWQNFSAYGVSLFWWLSVLSLVGIGALMRSIRTSIYHSWFFYLFLFVALSVWLGLWYGSWSIADNPDTSQITIANSYVRYWLPLYLLSTVFIASALKWIASFGRTRFARSVFMSALVIAVFALNIRVTFFDGQDALFAVRQKLTEAVVIRSDVLSHTENDAVIIVDRSDKLFFPHRRVLYPLRSDETYALMPRLIEFVPLYYYGITLPEVDVEYLNQQRLKQMGLQIKHLQTYGEESLYRILP